MFLQLIDKFIPFITTMFKKIFLMLLVAGNVFLASAQTPTSTIQIGEGKTTASFYLDKEVVLSQKSELHITASSAKAALQNSLIRLKSVNSWVVFDNLPQNIVVDSLVKFIYVDSVRAVNGSNVRVSLFKHGAVVMAHASGFKPLTVYTGQNFTGDSASYTIQHLTSLGSMDNKIRSFKLKRGYMATVATGNYGNGYSRVFIADEADIEISAVNYLLDESISMIRVFKWNFPSKKGWAGSDPNQYGKMRATWRYDWSNSGSSTNLVEYTPIKQNAGWPDWNGINSKADVTHLLGFNEPDRPDQSNMTFDQMMSIWPEFMKSGLRIGSPAWSNPWGGNGGNLFDFIKKCDELNYRVDFVALHCYWGGKSPQSWYNDLKYIHETTGRPLWITEWNNGANWTTEAWPSGNRLATDANLAKQLNDLKGILQVLDTAHFIERYSIYTWVEDCRSMFLSSGVPTPAGYYYAADNAPFAFSKVNEVVPGYKLNKNPKLSLSVSGSNVTVNIVDANGDYYRGFILEKKVGTGDFVEIVNSDERSVKSYMDTYDLSGSVKYRARVKLADGSYSLYTPVAAMDVTEGEKMQFGKLSVSNVDYNNVFFKQIYDEIPSIVLGPATNANSTVLMTPRVKLISKSSRFSVQASPWSYQNTTTLASEETIPYLILPPGTHNFNGLKAKAGRATVSSAWTNITFDTAFATVPVVFANQLIAGSTFATVVRIKDVTTTGFKAKIMKETGVTNLVPSETVGYIAIEQGKGRFEDHKVVVGKTSNNLISPSFSSKVSFNDTIENNILIAQMQTCNDDTVAAQLRSVIKTDSYVYMVKQREKSTNVTTASKEDAGWIIIDPMKKPTGILSPEFKALQMYPNPAYDKLYFNNETGVEKFNLYNLSGSFVKTLYKESNSLNISDLQPGFYVLKSEDGSVFRFIKQ